MSSNNDYHLKEKIELAKKSKNINPNLEKIMGLRQKDNLSNVDLMSGIKKRDRLVLSKAISLIESTLPNHREKALDLLDDCTKIISHSIKIGVSGTPGVGKSSFIDVFGDYLISQGFTVAVLAVDPSSSMTGGSILGDKTRMTQLANKEEAFIRPSAAGKTLGGVASATREAISICEAAQFDYILVETVGVGQSETLVSSMVDMYLVLLLPGGGDELQGIKRGIVEMADLIIINKADGDNMDKARISQRAYNNGLHYFTIKNEGWIPKAITTSALLGEGISAVFEDICSFMDITKKSGDFLKKREEQNLYWYDQSIRANLETMLFLNTDIQKQYIDNKKLVEQNHKSPFRAAYELMKQMMK